MIKSNFILALKFSQDESNRIESNRLAYFSDLLDIDVNDELDIIEKEKS